METLITIAIVMACVQFVIGFLGFVNCAQAFHGHKNNYNKAKEVKRDAYGYHYADPIAYKNKMKMYANHARKFALMVLLSPLSIVIVAAGCLIGPVLILVRLARLSMTGAKKSVGVLTYWGD